ncbi:4Fe-4S dicluster domain-containing protein [Fusibacter ferrireducens]|uniref:4Fe-4S dicluster domain-containing protein n=1 Tax=Fusibacter ferrireducens TaxID=2785058 RepID=A0ABR9ZQD2_9FIRM|nr:4Fe-4S dicluster domain-containing protein [Fusibacter ferrireducens]MBF4692680.1 4Fe-4S dicluster domain-containing protein [Fusibacter ferrireducens]
MRKYENHVQKIKSNVLIEVARLAFKGDLETQISTIPFKVNPGPEEQYRCCIFHERAITSDRVQMAIGGNPHMPGIIEVLESACDQCPVNRYAITEACRGCIAHRCLNSCPVDAIKIQNNKAIIDYNKCIECGKCKESCPYNAIADVMRPCRRDCPTNAIKIDHRKKAVIDYDLCISCGACVYQCPFGAIQDKSEIIPVIDTINSGSKHLYAMVAPAFATQFDFVDLGQVITGIKKLGFRDVVEVALGADLVTKHEADELIKMKYHDKVLTSSCCPSFVEYIKKKFPELQTHISSTVSPMTATARLIKAIDPEAVVVFIGPCISKKKEKQKTSDTDYVLTFEELAALMDAKDIQLESLESTPLNNASYYGRKFAASGGVTLSISNYMAEQGVEGIVSLACDGIEACDKALKLLKFNKLEADFIEGMACKGGCIKGPVTMHHGPKDLKALDAYSKMAFENRTADALSVFENINISLE